MSPTDDKTVRALRLVMVSWGVAVLLIATLLAAWVRSNQVQIERNQTRADEDMCAMISVFLSGPEPVDGPTGERSRIVRQAMSSWYDRRHCPPQ